MNLNSGLARRRQRRGCLRDGEFAFIVYPIASGLAWRRWRRGIWTKSLHPFAPYSLLSTYEGLAGRSAAAAGSCGSCWRSQECSSKSPPRGLCCLLCLTFAKKKKQAWKEVALHPLRSIGPAGPAGAAQEEHQQRNATAAGQVECCWKYVRAGLYVVSEYVQTRRLPPTLPSLAGPGRLAGGVRGKRDLQCRFYHPLWQLLE